MENQYIDINAVKVSIATAYLVCGYQKDNQELEVTTNLLIAQIKSKKMQISTADVCNAIQRGQFGEFGVVNRLCLNTIWQWLLQYQEQNALNKQKNCLQLAEKSSITEEEKNQRLLEMSRELYKDFLRGEIEKTDTFCKVIYDFLIKMKGYKIDYKQFVPQAIKDLKIKIQKQENQGDTIKFFLELKEKQKAKSLENQVENRAKKLALMYLFKTLKNEKN